MVQAQSASLGSQEELALVERLKHGDDAAYRQVVRLFGGRMLAVACGIVGDEEGARDAVQDAFLSAFRSAESFRGGALLSTWLHRIVVNASLMRLRASRRHAEESLEGLLPTFDDEGRATRPAQPWRAEAERGPLEEELRARVRRAIDALPAGHRTVLLLRDVEELSTQETAELLGVTASAIKVRLHRARQALRTLLEPMMLEESRIPRFPLKTHAPGVVTK